MLTECCVLPGRRWHCHLVFWPLSLLVLLLEALDFRSYYSQHCVYILLVHVDETAIEPDDSPQ